MELLVYNGTSPTLLCPGMSCEDNDNETDLYNRSLQFPSNGTTEILSTWSSIALMCVTSLLLAVLILATIVGNVFVIVAVFFEKNLQNVANYLVVSLAVADLMVACLVMPLGAVYEISGKWMLGPVLCDMWTSADVLCCSASILHLLSVAVDRYWAVTDIEYIRTRNKSRINTMIFMVWLVAAMVSLAPLLGWKDDNFLERIDGQKCLVSQDVGYQIFATCATFYVPLFFILLLYWKIWKTARNRIRHRVGKIAKVDNNKIPTSVSTTTASKLVMSTTFSDELSCHTATVETSTESAVGSPQGVDEEVVEDHELETQPVTIVFEEESGTGINPSAGSSDNQISLPMQSSPYLGKPQQQLQQQRQHLSVSPVEPSPQQIASSRKSKEQKKKETLEAKRERKAAKTLAIITGAFVVCWLPFFVMALGLALCSNCYLPDYVSSAFQWLGYFNSTCNPIIYTIFSPEFRQAFKRILCGRKARRRY